MMVKAKTKGRVPLSREARVHLAALIAIVGPPKSERAAQVYRTLTAFLIGDRSSRLPYVQSALQAIPPDRDSILHIVDSLMAWSRITHRDLAAGGCRTDRVVEVIQQIPRGGAEPYVRHLMNTAPASNLNFVFHPDTLERAKPDLRGLFGKTGGQGGYWDRTQDQRRILRD